MPAPRNTDLIVLQKHAENWQSKFHDLFDHITPHQWSYPHGVSAHMLKPPHDWHKLAQLWMSSRCTLCFQGTRHVRM